MKHLYRLFLAGLLLTGATNASAWGYNYNPWPVWTPMYWADEAMDEFDDDDDWYGPYGYGPYGYPGYGAPYGRYGHPGYGYGHPGYGYGYPNGAYPGYANPYGYRW